MPTAHKASKKTVSERKTMVRKSKKAMKGDKYTCDVCGLVVSVDAVCDCIDVCNILCCGKPMRLKKVTRGRGSTLNR